MQGKIRCVLYVLLFILAGNLCRQQSAPQPDRDLCYTQSSLFKQTPPQSNDTDHYDYSMIAPEITGNIPAANSVQKVFTRHQSTAIHSMAVKPAVSPAACRRSADLHPRRVDYYVFSLGKIVI